MYVLMICVAARYLGSLISVNFSTMPGTMTLFPIDFDENQIIGSSQYMCYVCF